MSRNEAAERLLDALDEDVAEYVDGPETTERALEIRKKSLDRIDAALATERRLTVEPLRRIQELQPNALAYIRQHGFVMDVVGPLTDDASELDRWKVLAFSLYTDLCQAESEARSILDDLATAAVDEEEGK